MSMSPDSVASPLIRDDDEGLFNRDINGQLVRLDSPTEADYERIITIQLDGQSVTVPMAEPLKDVNGNIVLDLEGRTKPRYTTIYDAAVRHYVKQPGDEAAIPIPTLCHLPHMTPVAVCRLCVVQIYGQKRGRRAAERKLLPACQHQVKDGMEVFTMADPGPDGDRVRQAVRTLTELLASDHLKPAPDKTLAADLAPFNELGQILERCGGSPARFQNEALSKAVPEGAHSRPALDASSPVFVVDHSACVLCDRCVRACNEVMENNVIGRTGKGVGASIGFDLNEPMGESDCVQCGECMVSCPTSAITAKPVAPVKARANTPFAEPLSAADLLKDSLFAGVPPKFLLWQKGLVTRRRLKAGDVLVRLGDPGNTAFIIKSGRLQATVYKPAAPASKGLLSRWMADKRPETSFQIQLTPADLIVGEMACLSGSPRSADLTALEDGEVWEVRRNVLDRLMRLPSQRQRLEATYRARSLDLVLQDSKLFHGIPPAEYAGIVDYLRHRITFLRVNPGQILFEQGDPATELYLVRLGYVRVGIRRYQQETRVLSRGPGTILGEIGLLGLCPEDARRSAQEVDEALWEILHRPGIDLGEAIPAGVRTATCSALGHLELARVRRADFLPMLRQFPTLRRRLIEQSLTTLASNQESHPTLSEYVDQGLYEGRSILALDLDLCTRCDECTKGCIQEHGTHSHGVPVTRLLRDGMRIGNYLVATSCRSCSDAHCMVGCPVDAIHRGKHLQIVIEDHCIGCGLCASNCPYGSIFMVPNENRRVTTHDTERPGRALQLAQPKAVTCDLCDAEGDRDTPEPRCVAACPHEAASRLTGEDLLRRVLAGTSKPG